MRIQAAKTKDLPDLLAPCQHLIPGDAAPGPDTAAEIADRLYRHPGSTIFPARLDSKPVASGAPVAVPNPTGSPFGLIKTVVTHAAFRQRRFRRTAPDVATGAVRGAGCHTLRLMTGSTRPGTLNFYRRAGFAQTKTAFQKRRTAARPRAAGP